MQGFFARLIEKQDLASVDRSRGRFRAFLLAALSNFLANEWDRERAQKRGGSFSKLSIDEAEAERRYAGDFAVSDAPERLFERQWARELLARALAALADEWKRAGRETLFARLKPFLTEEATGARQAEIAAELGLSENAVRIALHRLRKRLGELLRIEVADTVSDPREVEGEENELTVRNRAAVALHGGSETTMTNPKTCPRCAAPLPADGEPCPRCLLELGRSTPEPAFEDSKGSARRPRRRASPTIEEIAKRFPELEIAERIGEGGWAPSTGRARRASTGWSR